MSEGAMEATALDSKPAEIDIGRLMELIPHRYPFLMIDRVVEVVLGESAVGIKNVTVNEPFFPGHFPQRPVMPGVLIIEAMAQLGGSAILEPNSQSTTVPYLAGVDKFKFRRPVIPGDKLVMEVNVLWVRMNIGRLRAEARVDDQLVCSGELAFSMVSDSRLFRLDATLLHM